MTKKQYRLMFGTVRGKAGTVVQLSAAEAEAMGDLVTADPAPTPAPAADPAPTAEPTVAPDPAADPADDDDAGDPDELEQYATGAGWYTFPAEGDAEPVKLRGREKALAHLATLTQ